MDVVNGSEIGIIIGLSPSTIYDHIANEKLRAFKNTKDEWVIFRSDLLKYMSSYVNCPELCLDLFELYRFFVDIARSENRASEKIFHEKCRSFIRYTESLSETEKGQSCYYNVIWAMYKVARNKRVNIEIRIACANWLEYLDIIALEKMIGDAWGIEESLDSLEVLKELLDTPKVEDLILEFVRKGRPNRRNRKR